MAGTDPAPVAGGGPWAAVRPYLERESLAAFFDQNLPAERKSAAEAHLAACDFCLGQLAFLARAEHRELPPVPAHLLTRVHALLKPAREVGGDFYDFFFVDDDHLCLVVGDVSGKGVPAALFMAVTKTIIKSHAADDPSPASIITRANDDLSADNPASMFVTVFLAIVNTRTGECRYTNAGHNPGLLIRADGRSRRYPASGRQVRRTPRDHGAGPRGASLHPGHRVHP